MPFFRKSRRQTSFHQVCDHLTAPIYAQSTTEFWACCKNGFTRQGSMTLTNFDTGLLRSGISVLLIMLFEIGERDFEHVRLRKEDILNIKCEHLLLLVFCLKILCLLFETLLIWSVKLNVLLSIMRVL